MLRVSSRAQGFRAAVVLVLVLVLVRVLHVALAAALAHPRPMMAAHPRRAASCELRARYGGQGPGVLRAGVQCASSLGLAAAELPALHRLGSGRRRPRRMEKAAAHD